MEETEGTTEYDTEPQQRQPRERRNWKQPYSDSKYDNGQQQQEAASSSANATTTTTAPTTTTTAEPARGDDSASSKRQQKEQIDGATLQDLRKRPGAYHIFPSNYQPPPGGARRQGENTDYDDIDVHLDMNDPLVGGDGSMDLLGQAALKPASSQEFNSSSALILPSEVYDEQKERARRDRALAEAHEMGRQEALKEQLRKSEEQGGLVVRAIPVVRPGDGGLVKQEYNDKAGIPPSGGNSRTGRCQFVAVLAVIVVAVAAIVIPIAVINSSDNNSGGPSLSTNPQVHHCFPNVTELYGAVDAYLKNATNSAYAPLYGADITQWCVSHIPVFDDLFSVQRNPLAETFDADLSGWNLSAATSMVGMFTRARGFAGVGLNTWDVSNVMNMSAMFQGSTLMNADLSTWDVSRVVSMRDMFANATHFLGTGLDRWQLSNLLQDVEGMFQGASNFDVDLSGWHFPPQVFSLRYMFKDASSFRGLGLDGWNVSQVRYMDCIFSGASSLEVNLSTWDVSQVTNMTAMFSSASNFSGAGLNRWDVANVKETSQMFQAAHAFDADVSAWNVSQVVIMDSMFNDAFKFLGRGLELWDVSNVESMHSMFQGAATMDANVSMWNVSRVVDMHDLFSECAAFRGVGIDRWDVSRVQDMGWMLCGTALLNNTNFSGWDVSRVTSTAQMFVNVSMFLGTGLDRWDVSRVQEMYWMFSGASSVDVNLSSWNVSQATDMDNMFNGASSFVGVGLDRWDVSRVTKMNGMFSDALSFDANLSGWDVARVVSMYGMFQNATRFRGVGLDLWDVKQVRDTRYMFSAAQSFNTSLCDWGTQLSSSVDTSMMFEGTSCPLTGTPELTKTPRGPFCYACYNT